MVTASALSGLIKFSGREAWVDPFEEVLEEHFGGLREAFDLDFEGLDAAIGEGTGMMLWGCAFEDFLARRFEPDGRNVVDDYLKRRGFKESARSKAYMKALRDSVMSLYEPSDIRPGESMLLRDLFRGGEPIRVSEKSATRLLTSGTYLAARIVPEGDGHALSGGVLPFSQGARDVLFAALALADDQQNDDQENQAIGEPDVDRLLGKDIALDDEQLATLPPLVTIAWLTAAIRLFDEPSRPVVNADGDSVLAHDLRFPLREGVEGAQIAALLDAQDRLEKASDTFWNWWREPPASDERPPMAADALMLQTTLDDGRPVVGNLELEDRHLLLSVNSVARAESGRAMLEALLGDRIGEPETVVRTMGEVASEGLDASADLPDGVTPDMVHASMTQHYRKMLDEPAEQFGGLSPREAAKRQESRPKVVEWLEVIGDTSTQTGLPRDVLAAYDTQWLWDELGLAAESR